MNINELLKKVNLKNVSAEGTFEELPDGYYLCEVEKVEFTVSNTSGNDMIRWQLKIVEDGINFNEVLSKEYIQNTNGRKIFHYSVMKDEKTIERALSDLLKFENGEGQSILSLDLFDSKEAIEEAFMLLMEMKSRIWVHLNTDKTGTNQWKRFMSWKGAAKLELV